MLRASLPDDVEPAMIFFGMTLAELSSQNCLSSSYLYSLQKIGLGDATCVIVAARLRNLLRLLLGRKRHGRKEWDDLGVTKVLISSTILILALSTKIQ